MKTDLKIGKVTFSEELPKESRLWLERLIEKILLNEISTDVLLQASLLSRSMENKKILEKEDS
ncbi:MULTISPECIES: hypothetical protein [Bacillales]|jgi:hypothetical protein|uniref:hypothetical protein n=1 Tax=Bacillales TaxID=1385 RepID=UPI000501FA03|nr:hypothetical protein [Bacillus alveayuensis]KFL17142.1 hypothetical protein ET31_02285 [Geobacillus stearothermophilus]KFX36907.1 hypothetical protein GT94_00790 [Geobacillus stearothermophilus]WJQ00673.1 hypothetical protein QT234_01875 [Geobacillus stearothermophilus]WJQ04085.1 hypothetical protein QT236_01865 [Geobacillus stearothermophilus]